jgi:hypothetical protein
VRRYRKKRELPWLPSKGHFQLKPRYLAVIGRVLIPGHVLSRKSAFDELIVCGNWAFGWNSDDPLSGCG